MKRKSVLLLLLLLVVLLPLLLLLLLLLAASLLAFLRAIPFSRRAFRLPAFYMRAIERSGEVAMPRRGYLATPLLADRKFPVSITEFRLTLPQSYKFPNFRFRSGSLSLCRTHTGAYPSPALSLSSALRGHRSSRTKVGNGKCKQRERKRTPTHHTPLLHHPTVA